jgi:hypothetical protein
MSPIAKILLCLTVTGSGLAYMFPYLMFPNYYKVEFDFVDRKISDILNVPTSGGYAVLIQITTVNTKEAQAELNSLPPDGCNGDAWANVQIVDQESGVEIPMRYNELRSPITGNRVYRQICVVSLTKGSYKITSDVTNASNLSKFNSMQLRVSPGIAK